jgi:nucleoside-diphosphate-sugar epimerase
MSIWKNKRVLVTGGTGFIGSVLAEELLKRGAQVRVPIRAANYRALSTLRSKIDWMEGDLRSPEYCTALLAGQDHVFHLAAHRRNVQFHHQYCADVFTGNVEMSLALIRAHKEYRYTPVTFFSSANVPPKIDIIELAQADRTDGYILGKAVCETLWITASRQRDFPLLIVRPVGAYGERDTFTEESNVIPSLMVKAEKAKESLVVWGSGKQERVFLYVHDLVAALLRLLDVDAQGIQYILPPDTTTVKNLATLIRNIVRPDLPITFDKTKPEGSRSVATLPLHPCLEDFPWTPLRDGLYNTYEGWKAKAKRRRG